MIRCLSRLLVLAILLDLAGPVSSPAQTFTDDFDDSNDGDDAGWTRVDSIGTATGGTVSSTYSLHDSEALMVAFR